MEGYEATVVIIIIKIYTFKHLKSLLLSYKVTATVCIVQVNQLQS